MPHNHERCPQQGRGVPVLATPWLAGGVGRLDQPNFSLAVFALRGLGTNYSSDEWISCSACLPSLPACCGWHDRSVRRARGALGFACHVG
jgi:hypothetical protein